MTLQEFKPAYFTIEDRNSVVIVTVTESRLTEEDNIEQFGVELHQTIEGFGHYRLVIDLEQVKLMTSSAIGKLIGLHRNLHRREGRLVLCGISGMIHDILQTSKLLDYFYVAGDVSEAVALSAEETPVEQLASINKPR